MSVSYRNGIANLSGSHFKEKHNYKILPEHTAMISRTLPIALSDLEVHQLDILSGKIESHCKVSDFLTYSFYNYSFILKVGFAPQVSCLDLVDACILKPSG